MNYDVLMYVWFIIQCLDDMVGVAIMPVSRAPHDRTLFSHEVVPSML